VAKSKQSYSKAITQHGLGAFKVKVPAQKSDRQGSEEAIRLAWQRYYAATQKAEQAYEKAKQLLAKRGSVGKDTNVDNRSKPVPSPRHASGSWSNLSPEERRLRWWYDKMEWFRQQDRSKGRPVKDNSQYARAVSRMWRIQSEEKRKGVLDGTYDYTGKGLAEGKNYGWPPR
jgi:hypothetical protein